MNTGSKDKLEPLWQRSHIAALAERSIYSNAFRRWWKEDFSWDGLARKQILKAESRTQTLQENWSEVSVRLIEFAGRRWTIFHVPPHDLNGTPFDGEEHW